MFEYKWIYSVEFVLNGGSIEGALAQNYNPNKIELPSPKKTYYNFGGWYYDSNLTQQATSESILANPSDLILYAKWKTITLNLVYERRLAFKFICKPCYLSNFML